MHCRGRANVCAGADWCAGMIPPVVTWHFHQQDLTLKVYSDGELTVAIRLDPSQAVGLAQDIMRGLAYSVRANSP
jgi:hypothetical protein